MRVVITGANGTLGTALVQQAPSGVDVIGWQGRQDVDLCQTSDIVAALKRTQPDVVIHTAALSSVAACQRDPSLAHRINTVGTEILAQQAEAQGIRLVYVSTDLVFDGTQAPYHEEAPVCPLSCYGQTKAAGEQVVLSRTKMVVARVSLLFGRSQAGRQTFFDQLTEALQTQRPVTLFEDEWRTPLSLRTAAQALHALAASSHTGLLHIGGPERMSRFEMGLRLAAVLGISPTCLVRGRRADAPAPEPRPEDTSLVSTRWRTAFPNLSWPSFEQSVVQE